MTEQIELSERVPDPAELVELYDSVGWSAYTRDPARLMASIEGSSFVLVARRSDALIGLIRVISDGHTIAYVQDILVRAEDQNSGVGSRMLRQVLEHYRHVRQVVLLTDTEEAQRAFYERHGFTEVHDHDPELRSFVRMER
ncbi:GNAT family N-acetyltransferase [uncultured Agrococcus sp.]|uniref:GNAT family N-acetyltransferase n=1 Tax=uncultured Agrococcus sp. TaxID=382258 RepID=UPI0025D310E2|nr:GNAT family N-acetyltransferase [uncultured Agrococcus sp.]